MASEDRTRSLNPQPERRECGLGHLDVSPVNSDLGKWAPSLEPLLSSRSDPGTWFSPVKRPSRLLPSWLGPVCLLPFTVVPRNPYAKGRSLQISGVGLSQQVTPWGTEHMLPDEAESLKGNSAGPERSQFLQEPAHSSAGEASTK